MSKSYGKYKMCGVCWGNNTPYYKNRRHKVRLKNNQSLRTIMTHHNPEYYDDVFDPYIIPKKNDKMEPSDGTWKLTAKYLKRSTYKYPYYATKNNRIKK
jgi:hypothetical protein